MSVRVAIMAGRMERSNPKQGGVEYVTIVYSRYSMAGELVYVQINSICFFIQFVRAFGI